MGEEADGPERRPLARPSDEPAPPERPPLSAHRPPPALAPPPPPGPVRAARTLWIFSIVAGLIAIGFAVLAREGQSEQLTRFVRELAPDRADETLESVAAVLFVGALVALGVVIGVEALLARAMLRRHGAVRVALLAVLVLHAVVAVLADDLIARGGGAPHLFVLLVAQLLLAGAATVVAFLPAASGWFRGPSDGDQEA